MKKVVSLVTALSLLLTIAVAQTNSHHADDIIGIYWSPKKDAKIELYKKGDRYFGKSIWLSKQRKDVNNPNPSLRDRELLGVELLANFSYKEEAYQEGQIYDPESGKTL